MIIYFSKVLHPSLDPFLRFTQKSFKMKIQWFIFGALVVAQGSAKGKGASKRADRPARRARPTRDQVNGSITYNGSGCPPNSASIALAEDRSSFTIIFSEFVASKSPGSSPRDARKDCTITVNLVYPEKWSFAIQAIDYRGYAQLPDGITAIHRSRFNFQGSNPKPSTRTTMVGPLNDDYFIREEQPLEFADCRARMRGRIRTVLQLRGDSPQPAQLTIDSVDNSVTQTYTIEWKEC
jgi:hypothetical protein